MSLPETLEIAANAVTVATGAGHINTAAVNLLSYFGAASSGTNSPAPSERVARGRLNLRMTVDVVETHQRDLTETDIQELLRKHDRYVQGLVSITATD